MKKLKLLLAVVAFFFMCGMAQAAPFLVCDAPDPASQVISYVVYQDGVEVATPLAESDGSLRMDLQAITPGVYEWTAKAVNAWGQSEASDPYVSPSGAGKPLNTRMVP